MAAMEPEQLSQYFAAYGRELVLYARQWVKTDQAEDAVQEVFIRLIKQAEPPRNVKAWLFRAVRNGAISQWRSQQRRIKHTEKHAAEQTGWFEIRPGDLIDAAAAQQVLETLPAEQREIVTLRIWGQMTLKEIAEVIDAPQSTVFSRYTAALEAIRKKMEQSCPKKST
ncbi:MAG: RNA polymerase sigma factor [Planctomycetes bacterium]|nr:RNA polymerase sigma factor [Planctomycetota bacterium]